MKASVDPDLCVGTGSCVAICPEVFQLNDDGIAEVKKEQIPADLEDSCREAAESCPVEAIKLS